MNKDQKNTTMPKLQFPEFKISSNWSKDNLAKFCDVVVGGTPSTTVFEYWNGDIGWIGSGELKNDIIKSPTKYITELGLKKSSTYLMPEGTVVLAMTGATLGKIGWLNFSCAGNQSVAGFINLKNLEAKFLFYELQLITKQILSLAGGGAQSGINKSSIESLELQVPSLQEQQKIAFCLSYLDELIAAHTQKLDALKGHKKGLMQQLFPAEGEKVPKRRFEEFKDSGEWEEKAIGELGYFTGGGTPSKADESYWNGNIPWISSSDIEDESITRISMSRFITEEALKDSATKKVPPNSILLVSRVGVGKLAISNEAICTSQDFTSLTPNTDDVYFLAYLLKSKKERLLGFSQGMAIKGFTKDDISNLIILLPSKNEQQKIASCLSSLDELITAQAEKIEQLKMHKKGLMQGLFPNINEPNI